MKKHKLLAIIFLAAIAQSCSDKEKSKINSFSFDSTQFKTQYRISDTLKLAVLNPENKKIDSIVYYVNDKNVGTQNSASPLAYVLDNAKLGYQSVKAVVFSDNASADASSRIEVISSIQPKLINYTIVNTYPHDLTSYTQGLEFYRDTLFEGTGNGAGNGTGIRGISKLRKVDYKTGKVHQNVDLPMEIFGEGITILNNKVYQLTYQNNEGYVYDADNLKKIKTFPYFKKMEGWGLTNDGTNLYMSDGSEKIWKLDPETMKEVDYINVYTAGSKIKAVNELEWIDGKIFGNIYGRDAIAIIDPKTGSVEGVINLAELKSKVTKHPDLDVLNGIAYNPKTKTLFVTGKNWDKLFEIRLSE